MSRIGKYKVPSEYKDEDIWFRFFTKKQLFFMLIGGVISIALLLIFNFLHMLLIGIIFFIVIMALAVVLPRKNMPNDKYLWGGGIPLDTLFLRVVIKRMSFNKVIYVSNVDNGEEL